jgi:outer membrane lipoprotein SlyB
MKFTAEQLEYLERNIDMDDLGIIEVRTNIQGIVWGDVGDVRGSVFGNVRRDVKGEVWGDVGDVLGHVLGDVIGNVKGDVEGDVLGAVRGTVDGKER